MSKETAVEYMYRLLDVMTPNKDDESADIWEAIYHRALAMEREQIIDAFDEGQEYEYQHHVNGTPKFDSETYFIETYKGGEQ